MGMVSGLPDLSNLDADTLRQLLITQHNDFQEKLLSRDHEIEHLKLVIAKLRRMMFGTKSEKIAHEVQQLELKLEELETARAQQTSLPFAATAKKSSSSPARRPLPEQLSRETRVHQPEDTSCPDCGGELHCFGEDVSEVLDYVPASFRVIR